MGCCGDYDDDAPPQPSPLLLSPPHDLLLPLCSSSSADTTISPMNSNFSALLCKDTLRAILQKLSPILPAPLASVVSGSRWPPIARCRFKLSFPRGSFKTSSENLALAPSGEIIPFRKYIAAGLSREVVPLAVANYGDNPSKAMENGRNAARAGLKAGDQVLYTGSFFGDELWPARAGLKAGDPLLYSDSGKAARFWKPYKATSTVIKDTT